MINLIINSVFDTKDFYYLSIFLTFHLKINFIENCSIVK